LNRAMILSEQRSHEGYCLFSKGEKAQMHLEIFEQTATEGRKRCGRELGRKYGAQALRDYQTQRGKRSRARQFINENLEINRN
jgi:hypothetical protein